MFENRVQLLAETLPAPLRQRRELALALLAAGVASVEPGRCTARGVRDLSGQGLEPQRPLSVLAMGKASLAMAHEALRLCNVSGGIVHCFESGQLGPLRLEACGHPLPCPGAAEQGQRVLDFATSLGADDVVLCLVSGGASAMLVAPAPGLDLAALRQTTTCLLACGAGIGEVNTVRRALSRTKGGGLLAALHPAAVFNIILSDVPGEPPEVVSSGPTLPPQRARTAAAVVDQYQLWERLPAPVVSHLRGRPETTWQRPEDLRLTTCVAGDNDTAVAAVVDAAGRLGLRLARAPGIITGEAAPAGAAFVRAALAQGADGFVSGGECTVTVRGEGRGGRAQEFVLGALGELDEGLVVALGTVGIDGSSDAAGALADAAVLAECGGDFTPAAYLEHNDSHSFFTRTASALRSGRTGTNVSDLYLYLR